VHFKSSRRKWGKALLIKQLLTTANLSDCKLLASQSKYFHLNNPKLAFWVSESVSASCFGKVVNSHYSGKCTFLIISVFEPLLLNISFSYKTGII
jgi:hypothetical protein